MTELLTEPLTAVVPAYCVTPRLIRQIPFHCASHTGLEGLFRLPLQFPANLAGIDRIALVMAGPVRNEGDLLAIGRRILPGLQLIQQAADLTYHLDIGLFVVSPNVIDLAGLR